MTDVYLYDRLKLIVDNYIVAVKGLSCNMRYGYWPEIAANMTSEGRDTTLSAARYPFVMLNAGFEEEMEPEHGIFSISSPTIHIVTRTNKTESTVSRETTIYKATLAPIYNALIEGIKKLGYFNVIEDRVECNRKMLSYLVNMGKPENQLNDYIDAIEINFKNLRLYPNFE